MEVLAEAIARERLWDLLQAKICLGPARLLQVVALLQDAL